MIRAADTDLFRDKIELSLDGKQVFYLFFGGAVVVSMVFVLGVLVGRQVEARSQSELPGSAIDHADPLAALDALDRRAKEDELAFRRALRGRGDPTTLGAIDAKIAASAVPASDTSADTGSSANVPEPDTASVVSPDESRRTGASEGEPTLTLIKAAGSKGVTKPPKPPPASPPSKPASTAKDSASLAPDGPKAEVKVGKPKFTLQLSSFQDEDEAKSFSADLETAGYTPYIKRAVVPDKGTWFRVRIGSYITYDSALDAKAKFEKDRGIIAYVTRL